MENNFRFNIMEDRIQIKPEVKDKTMRPQVKIKGLVVRYLLAITFSSLLFLTSGFKLEAFDLKGFLFSNIPTPPYLNNIGEESIIVNGLEIKRVSYRGENINISEIIEFYKKVLPQRGYMLEQEYSDKGYFGVNFANKKGDFIRVFALEGSTVHKPGSIFVNISYNKNAVSKLADYFTNADLDAPGQDIPWLKRYPEARRAYSVALNNGMTTVSYLLDNADCIQCVVSFYKEEMSKADWTLEEELHNTKDQAEQTVNLDLDSLGKEYEKADVSLEQKEKLRETVEKMKLAAEEQKKYNMDPDETVMLNFKKKEEKCTISVAYKDMKGIQNQSQNESPEETEEYLKSLPENVSAKLKRVMGLGVEKSIAITIMYIPSTRDLRGQKAWF